MNVDTLSDDLDMAKEEIKLANEEVAKLHAALTEANRILGICFLGGALLSDDQSRVLKLIAAALESSK